MKLESEGQPAIHDPQPSQVHHAVSSLSLPDRTFLILSRNRASYIQIAIVGQDRFRVECRDGQQPLLYAPKDLSLDEAARVLEGYRQGDDSWRREIEWQPVWRPPDVWDRVNAFFMFAALALILVAAVEWRGLTRERLFGIEPFQLFTIAILVYLPSLIIDLRRFRTLDAESKVRTIGALVVVIMVLVIYCIELATGR